LTNRERLDQGLELMIDCPALDWGIHIDRVEIKDVALPDAMKRSMSPAGRGRTGTPSPVIHADGAAGISQTRPSRPRDGQHALQLRLLETTVEVAAEKNSTLVLPLPGRAPAVP
jgi:hypothetical protein